MEEPVLLSISVPGPQIDDLSGRAWLAGATGIAEEWIAGGEQVRLLVSCEPADQAAVALALGGNASTVDSWTPVIRRVTVPFEGALIDLDVPANVFGDGAHPTTLTCLALVSTLVETGDHVVDLGCGAGLLAVAAAQRGATVTAVDIWEPAVDASRRNVDRAGVGGAVTVELRSIAPTDRADVVFANIGAATLVELAPTILAATDGPIVLSGILESQADDVAAAYDSRSPIERRTIRGWTTLVVTQQAVDHRSRPVESC